MATLALIWHGEILKHGDPWLEMRPTAKRNRRYGMVVECNCGKRWFSRAPWFREA